MNTGQHLFHLEGFDNVVIGALLQTCDLVLRFALCGEHNNRGLIPLPNLLQHRPAVHNGEHNIQKH